MISPSRRRNTRYKALPPHTNEAWPPASSGEVSKPFIIGIIVVALLIILSLFLFFSERAFVGKAFTGVLGTGGLLDVLVNPVAGDSFFLTVVANIGTAQTAALNFRLNLPAGVTCNNIVSITNLLGWDSTNGAALTRAECINGQIQFEYATYNSELTRTGMFGMARIDVNGLPAGQYDFTFSTLDVIDYSDPRQSNPNFDLVGDGLGLTLTVAAPAADDDNDGVVNSNDRCPNTPAGEVVDVNGCSASQQVSDSDGDNVPDDIDLCPNTAFATAVDANGCSQAQLDVDGDGVLNVNDNCPNTPAGRQVDAYGCPLITIQDADNDGVNDVSDLCPGTAAGITVDATGCPVTEEAQPSGGSGGGRRCIQNVTCSSFSYCNSALQQSRTCVDNNNCIPEKVEVVSCLACQESWICSQWSACSNGQQVRACIDEHSCGTLLQQPALQKSCQQATVPGPQPQQVSPTIPTPQVQKPSAVPFWRKYLVYLIALAVLAVAGTILGILYVQKHQHKTYNFDELKDWIQKEESLGTSEEGIRQILAQQTGWTAGEVAEAFKDLHGTHK